MNLQISKYCLITDGEIHLDGKMVFSDKSRENFKEFIIEAYKQNYITYPKFFKMDNLSKLGFLASELILREETERDIPKPDMGVGLMNSSSSLDTDMAYQETINPGENYFPSPSVFVYTLPNIVIGEICIRNKIQGENTFLISEHFNANILNDTITHLFNSTTTKKCLTGWLELKNDFYYAFLMLVETQKETDRIIFETNSINNLFNKK